MQHLRRRETEPLRFELHGPLDLIAQLARNEERMLELNGDLTESLIETLLADGDMEVSIDEIERREPEPFLVLRVPALEATATYEPFRELNDRDRRKTHRD